MTFVILQIDSSSIYIVLQFIMLLQKLRNQLTDFQNALHGKVIKLHTLCYIFDKLITQKRPQITLKNTHKFMEQQSKSDDLIFYALPNQTVNLAPTLSAIIYDNQVQHDLSTQGTLNALKYRYPLGFLGKQYAQIVVPCIPAKEPRFVGKLQNITQNGSQHMFLVKTTKNSDIKGFASGKRSAIVQKYGKYLRFKGCGNFLQGFSIQNNEPRGCHYFHTLKREILMTQEINQILLKQIGMPSGNSPRYAFEYKKEDIKKLDLKFQGEMIGKYCCVFETVGDRRIGTHIISPLEILFINLCDLSEISWKELFEKNNRIQEGEPVQFLANWLFLEPGKKFLTQFLQIDPNQNYITLDMINLKTIQTQRKGLFLKKMLQKLVKNEHEKEQVSKIIEQLQQNFKDLVEIIVEKVGYQMGEIKRIFCDYEINWGYFNDHGALWHCNAHLNNFVLTFPKAENQFLVPLDFDLSFFKKEFIRIDLDEEGQQTYGKFDENQFQNFLCSQYQAMQLSVSGIEVMSNFKYSIEYEENKTIDPLSPIKMARIVFRDTLLKAFRSGMRKNVDEKERINKKWNKNIQGITAIIRASLIISQDFQT